MAKNKKILCSSCANEAKYYYKDDIAGYIFSRCFSHKLSYIEQITKEKYLSLMRAKILS